ncbi:substrate-binding domain-containing protein [Pelagibius marinus]|uniref:substrate-binding domain-containing protein n=1 Tax=Pelagibius marinus TaxID=2762760 RepID=UPI00187269C4|nr:substrate-binding domain-containing protein [Pelagibius marinus]
MPKISRLSLPLLVGPLLAALTLPVAAPAARAQDDPREALSVVAGTAAFPLAVTAAEQFSAKTNQAMPVVERLGSSRALQAFCAGQGPRFADAAVAERRMTRAELSTCQRKNIAVTEAVFGHQAVVLGQLPGSAPAGLSLRQIFLALARQVPLEGKLVDNPYRLWSDIDFALPVAPIEVYGPPPGSPLRDAFIELVMEPAAASLPELRGWTAGQRAALAGALRADGVFTELGEDEAETAQRLAGKPGALGIFSFNFLERQGGRLNGLAVEGVNPRAAAIADGRYAPSRPLYLYAKPGQAKDSPGLNGYLAEVLGPAAAGPGGYLTTRGLVPLPAANAGGVAPPAN